MHLRRVITAVRQCLPMAVSWEWCISWEPPNLTNVFLSSLWTVISRGLSYVDVNWKETCGHESWGTHVSFWQKKVSLWDHACFWSKTHKSNSKILCSLWKSFLRDTVCKWKALETHLHPTCYLTLASTVLLLLSSLHQETDSWKGLYPAK